jgi:hypothetical protein
MTYDNVVLKGGPFDGQTKSVHSAVSEVRLPEPPNMGAPVLDVSADFSKMTSRILIYKRSEDDDLVFEYQDQ